MMICLIDGKEGDKIGDQQSSHQQDISKIDGCCGQQYQQDQEQWKQFNKNQPHNLGHHEHGGKDGQNVPLQKIRTVKETVVPQ